MPASREVVLAVVARAAGPAFLHPGLNLGAFEPRRAGFGDHADPSFVPDEAAVRPRTFEAPEGRRPGPRRPTGRPPKRRDPTAPGP